MLTNGWFDWTMYERAGMVPQREWPQYAYDLQLDWHSVEPLLAGSQQNVKGKTKGRTEKALRFLASLLIDGAVWWKDYNFHSDDEQFRLCGIDNCYTLAARHNLRRILTAERVT